MLISILLPNLNNVGYLQERLETVYSQTYQNWELVIVDNFSDDGAWELLQQHAAKEKRIRLSQAPRNGMYANWNNCLELAQGELIYIATSDDTMKPNCLEELKKALEQQPTCDLAQCGLEIIDPDGLTVPEPQSWDHYTLGSYNKELVRRSNLRIAPHDGLLHTALFTVCTSITQLLIKKKVFDKLGNFETKWGSVGDFEWQMRVALVFNSVFIPEKLASWRIHPQQATGTLPRLEVCRRMLEMAKVAFTKAQRVAPDKLDDIDLNAFLKFLELDLLEYEYRNRRSVSKKLLFLPTYFFQSPSLLLDWLQMKMRRMPWNLWACPERTRRIESLLSKWDIPRPVFID